MKKVLILIRDKLGDSLIAAQAVLALRDQYPKLNITLMIRRDYAYFLKEEAHIQLIPYRNAWQAWARICLLRVCFSYDAFIVLRGFGKKIAQLGKLVRANRKIHMQGSFPSVFTEYPSVPVMESDALIERAWQTLRLYAPALQASMRLYFPSLVVKRRGVLPTFIGICPITDEIRKNLSPAAIRYLIHYIRQTYPEWPIRILVRQLEEGKPYQAVIQDEMVQIIAFESTPKLFTLFTEMVHYYGADTGLYHLAAAMNIPATVFFGPTQPHKVVLPEQHAHSIRIVGLGDQHCDEKRCQHAICIELATRNLSNSSDEISIASTPRTCPMRTLSIEQIGSNQLINSTAIKPTS